MKKTLFTIDAGIFPSKTEPAAAKLLEFIQSHPENSKIIIAPGEYFLEQKIALSNLKNVEIAAYGVKFITAYDAREGYKSKGAFSFTKCEDCNILGMTIATENPANITGRITAVDIENRTFDVKVFDEFPVTGDEIIHGLDSCHENLSNDNNIFMADSNQRKFEKIGDQLLRFHIHPNNAECLPRIFPGELICLRHTLYASPPFNFYSCARFLLEDVTIETSPGICCGIYPRSSDFTFRRFDVRLPNGSKQIYSCCADGIHFKGLTGTLLIEDCNFINLGDDALNIHNEAGTIYTVENNVIKAGMKRPNHSFDNPPPYTLPEEWATTDDIIYMYDEDTLEKVGQFKVVSFKTEDGYNHFEYTDLEGEIKQGLKLANSAYFAKVIVRNCDIRSTRARGLLLQTHNVLVENNRFSIISGPAVLVSCDVKDWNEMAPGENVVIRNNVFFADAIGNRQRVGGGIVAKVSHSSYFYDIKKQRPTHKNITITGNKFVNMKDSAIFFDAVDGATITDNEFINCCYDSENRPEEYRYLNIFHNCENITCENNTIIDCNVPEKNI
ncbi:MAG: right-handed parallel beta-helix repeat-containing protein [Ruminococcaceae bacterium]|nr:right-handed parallel beta-helix repeat-containing protein [Oscillospiraceae bacterium]